MKHQWPALDVFKFLAISSMVILHAVVWLISPGDTSVRADSFVFQTMVHYPWIAPLFYLPLCIPATAGGSFRLQLENSPLTDYRKLSLLPVVKVVFGLAILSFLMNAATWGWRYLEWDVLQFVGVCYLISACILKWTNEKVLLVLGVLAWVLSAFTHDFSHENSNRLLGIFVGTEDASVFWPLIPWFSTFVAGYFLAGLWIRFGKSVFQGFLIAGVLITGICLLFEPVWFPLSAERIWGPEIFQPGLAAIPGLLGMALIILGLFSGAKEIHPKSVIGKFSEGILWIYLFHTVAGVPLSHWVSKNLSLEVAIFIFPIAIWFLSLAIASIASVLQHKRIRIQLTKQS